MAGSRPARRNVERLYTLANVARCRHPGIGARTTPSHRGAVLAVTAFMLSHHHCESLRTCTTFASGYNSIITSMKSDGGRSAVTTKLAVAFQTSFRVSSLFPASMASYALIHVLQ